VSDKLPAKVLYEKRGRRYHPVAVEAGYDAMRMSLGAWLVVNDGNGSSFRKVRQHPPEVQAALERLRRRLADLILGARVQFPELTQEQTAKVVGYIKRLTGKDPFVLWQIPSMYDLVEQAVDQIGRELETDNREHGGRG